MWKALDVEKPPADTWVLVYDTFNIEGQITHRYAIWKWNGRMWQDKRGVQFEQDEGIYWQELPAQPKQEGGFGDEN